MYNNNQPVSGDGIIHTRALVPAPFDYAAITCECAFYALVYVHAIY